ncbi:hypothetical protein [Litoribacter ruber]|nr:hypothetical protein [Litoribacter alkaliphilus]
MSKLDKNYFKVKNFDDFIGENYFGWKNLTANGLKIKWLGWQ